MNSMFWLALSLPVTMLLFLVCLLLIQSSSRRGSLQSAQQLNLVVAAALKTSSSSMEDLMQVMKQISEDNRSTTVALVNSAKEMTAQAQVSTRELIEAARQQTARMMQQGAYSSTLTERGIVRLHESQTSMLATAMRMLGTRDGLSYAQTAAADRATESAAGPYTTGDEDEIARRQALVDDLFNQVRVGDTGGGDRSDFADFGLAEV